MRGLRIFSSPSFWLNIFPFRFFDRPILHSSLSFLHGITRPSSVYRRTVTNSARNQSLSIRIHTINQLSRLLSPANYIRSDTWPAFFHAGTLTFNCCRNRLLFSSLYARRHQYIVDRKGAFSTLRGLHDGLNRSNQAHCFRHRGDGGRSCGRNQRTIISIIISCLMEHTLNDVGFKN